MNSETLVNKKHANSGATLKTQEHEKHKPYNSMVKDVGVN